MVFPGFCVVLLSMLFSPSQSFNGLHTFMWVSMHRYLLSSNFGFTLLIKIFKIKLYVNSLKFLFQFCGVEVLTLSHNICWRLTSTVAEAVDTTI